MKRLLIALLLLSLCLSLVGCDRYYSSYSSIASVRSNTSDKAYISFMSLSGRMVFKLRPRERSVLTYEAELSEGSVTVSYDIDGTLTELITLSDTDTRVGDGITVDKDLTVYIVVDAEDAKNGKITVSLKDIE